MQQIVINAALFSKDQILKKLAEQGIRTNHYAEQFLSHPRFSLESLESITVVIASLQEIGLENGATLLEIFQRIPQVGLKPCPLETGPLLRLAWVDQPKSQNSILSGTHEAPNLAVTVLSDTLEDSNAFPKGLYLRNVDGVRWLRGYVCDAEYRFPGTSLFAFELQRFVDHADQLVGLAGIDEAQQYGGKFAIELRTHAARDLVPHLLPSECATIASC